MTVMVTATVALPAFPSVATTVTGCVAPAVRVTPARVTIWPELDPMSKEAAPVPSRLYVSVSSSASVAVTLPITVPADALSRTVNERAPAENTGARFSTTLIVTVILALVRPVARHDLDRVAALVQRNSGTSCLAGRLTR